MGNKIICFSDNRADVTVAFKDYLNHYLSEVENRQGYSYDKTVDFATKEAKVNGLIAKEVSKLANVDFSAASPAQMSTNPMVQWGYFAVVNSLIDMVIPEVLDKSIGIYTEQRFVDFGDSMTFTVAPNDLFYVSKAGRDQRTVNFQKQFEGQATVVPENRAISVSVNLYKVMCQTESIAKFVTKAILSLEAQITREVFTAFNTAMNDLPSTGNAKLKVTGYSKTEAIRLAQTVTAYNSGAKAVFLGTPLALSYILPDGDKYRYFIDSDYVKMGYVRTAFGYDTLVMPQVADWTAPYKLALDDKKIYVVSPSSQKPVKLVYEGSAITNTINAFDAANLTESTTINKSYGIAIATNAIAGEIDLS